MFYGLMLKIKMDWIRGAFGNDINVLTY